MSYRIPETLIGTTQVELSARSAFGAFLDGAAGPASRTLLTEGGSWVWEALRENNRQANWDVCAIVPHVAGYVREATDYGMLGAGWRRLRRMNPLSWFRLGWQGLINARGVLRKDFPTLLTLLLELEMANFRRVRPPVVFLHPQMTDLLLAMNHAKALEKAVAKIRKGFRSEPGLATYNAGTLVPRLQTWGIEVPYLLTAIHPRGLGMRPTREECEDVLTAYQGQLVATVSTELDRATTTYWKRLGVSSALYDAREPDGEALRQWRTWRTPQAELLAVPAAVTADEFEQTGATQPVLG
jgi:hypothetical protein